MGFWQEIIRTRPDANPVPDGTSVAFKTVSDNAVQLSTTVGAVISGSVVYQADGWPGDMYYEVTYPSVSGETRRQSSVVRGPAGPVNLGELGYVLCAFTPGVVRNDRGALAPTKHASTMTINIANGTAVGKYGMTYTQYTNPKGLAIANNGSGSDRIDRIVVRFGVTGAVGSGMRLNQTGIFVKQGTPGAGDPGLTDNGDLYELSLASVLIPAGVSNISGVTLTDTRAYWETPPVGQLAHPIVPLQNRKRDYVSTSVVVLGGNGQDIGQLAGSITLENGITYDIFGRATVMALAPAYGAGAPLSQRHIETAIYLGDLANINENGDVRWQGHDNQDDYVPISNEFVRAGVVGTGSAMACGVRIRKQYASRDGAYLNGVFVVQAIPRPRQ